MSCNEKKLKQELRSFQKLWKGGTNLSKRGWDECREARLPTQNINEIARICIEPYINPDINVLEIGANGGGWTWKFLSAKNIYCFDALDAKHTGFWNNIERKANIYYFKVEDFLCEQLEDDSIDYVFSYDVFCHISYSGACAYFENLYNKLRTGANCFVMIADAKKYSNKKGRKKLMKRAGFSNFKDFVEDYDGPPNKGRWYWYGTELFCNKLKELGYMVVNQDVAIDSDKLNPIIHFRK